MAQHVLLTSIVREGFSEKELIYLHVGGFERGAPGCPGSLEVIQEKDRRQLGVV